MKLERDIDSAREGRVRQTHWKRDRARVEEKKMRGKDRVREIKCICETESEKEKERERKGRQTYWNKEI